MVGDAFTEHEREYAAQLEASPEKEAKQTALYLATIVQDLSAEVQKTAELVEARLERQGNLAAEAAITQTFQAVKGWLQNLRSLIQGIAGKLWRVISNLLTPKEWKVRGSAGTSVLGITSAEVEITFGP